MSELHKIYPGGDAALLMRIPADEGTFQFSDTGISNVIVELSDYGDTAIRKFSLNALADHSSLVPVVLSGYDSGGKPEYSLSNDTDMFILYLSGQYHNTTNTMGRIKALIRINRNNVNFVNDNVYNFPKKFLTTYILSNV